MTFFNKFKNLFRGGTAENGEFGASKLPPYVRRDVDPLDEWEMIGVLGDGAFGKVQHARHRQRQDLHAAAKACDY